MIDINLVDSIKEYIEKFHSTAIAVLLTGSTVEGKRNIHSDVDILVFVQDRGQVFSETTRYKDLKIQGIIIPVQNLSQILWVDYSSYNGVFLDMISKGLVIFDQQIFLDSLIKHCKSLLDLGPNLPSEDEVLFSRVKLTSIYQDLLFSDNLDLMIVQTGVLIDKLSEFKLKCASSWVGDGKYRMRHLYKVDNDFAVSLTSATRDLYKTLNRKPLLDLVRKTLEDSGGFVEYYTKGKSFFNVQKNYFVVEMSLHNRERKIISRNLSLLFEFLENNLNYRLPYYSFLSKSLDAVTGSENIYIVVEAAKNKINNEIISELELYCYKYNIKDLKFPVQYDIVYNFGSGEIYEIFQKHFVRTTKIFFKNDHKIFNESFQIETSLSIFKTIKDLWFSNNDKDFRYFLDYILKKWMAYSQDSGITMSTSHLLRNREKTLKKYEFFFNENSSKLISFYVYSVKMSKILDINKVIDNHAYDTSSFYNTVLINKQVENDKRKKFYLYGEFIERILSILMVKDKNKSIIPFIVSRLNLND